MQAQQRGENITANLPEVLSFADFAHWLAEQDREPAVNFWREQLADVNAPTPLPLIGFDAPIDSDNIDELAVIEHRIALNQAQTANLRQLVQSAQTTVNVLVQGAWALLLSRYSGEQQVVFGVISAGRPPQLPGVDQMVGLFINNLPMVVDVEPNATVTQWLQLLHSQLVEREGYGYLPLLDIEQLSPARQTLFDSILVFENYPMEEVAVETQANEADLKALDIKAFEENNYGISLIAHLVDKLSIKVQVKSRLMSAKAVEQIAGHLQQLLLSLLEASHTTVGQLTMLSPGEVLPPVMSSVIEQMDKADDVYLEPQTPTAQRLAVIWADLLELKAQNISATANFFALGGHSLLTIELVAAIAAAFNVVIPLKACFVFARLDELAGQIEAQQEKS